MPQGKMKTKTKLPVGVKAKRKDKGPATTKRGRKKNFPRYLAHYMFNKMAGDNKLDVLESFLTEVSKINVDTEGKCLVDDLLIYAPIAPKKAKNAQVQKLKKLITKTVNETAEEELRAIALDGKKTLLSKKDGSTSKPKKNKK